MINISQPFHRTSASPIDETIAITKAQMVLIDDNLMPDYYFTICQDDGYIYLYDKSATPTISTGKFTKFEGGGGGGGTGTPGLTYSGTLVAANWDTTTNEQTITFTDYDEAFGGVVGIPSTATDAHKDAYGKSEISIVSQSGATVTFKAEEIPTIDLPVLIYCGGSLADVVDTVENGNMHPVTSNAVFDIINNVETFTDTIPIYGGTITAYKSNGWVMLNLSGLGSTTTLPLSVDTVFYTLPEKYRPVIVVNTSGTISGNDNYNSMVLYWIESNGNIKVYGYQEIVSGKFTITYYAGN